jgi:ribonuclease VapC
VTDGMGGAVSDASALLAFLQGEADREIVRDALVNRTVINVVNHAEVLSRLTDGREEPAAANCRLEDHGLVGDLLQLVPLVAEDSVAIARLRTLTRAMGHSLGDRACLATALRLGRPVITADRNWAAVHVGVTIRLIRS